jgi:hypothetical protein
MYISGTQQKILVGQNGFLLPISLPLVEIFCSFSGYFCPSRRLFSVSYSDFLSGFHFGGSRSAM